MEYEIILSPDLDLTPADFVAGWNENEERRQMAAADLKEGAAKGYDPTFAVAVAISVASSIAASVVANIISDFLKERLGKSRQFEIIEMDRPDGSPRLVIRRIEE
jgi:hypothetical protein